MRKELRIFILSMVIGIPTESNGSNPVILRFSCYDDRELILSCAKKLLKTGKKNPDRSPCIHEKRERGNC